MGRFFQRDSPDTRLLHEAQKAMRVSNRGRSSGVSGRFVGLRPLLIASVALLFSGLLGYAIIRSVREDLELRDIDNWVYVDAVVMKASVSSHRQGKYSTNYLYRHQLQYRYEVGGQSFINDRVSLGATGAHYHAPQNAVERLPPVGKTIRIRVNPADPARSTVYFNANNPGARVWAIVGLTIMELVALGFAVVTFLLWRTQTQAAQASGRRNLLA